MTNIDEMEAGRELDALVAEKVMGWTLKRDRWFDGERETGWRTDPPYFQGDWQWWRPSLDIAAASEVCRKMTDLGYDWLVSHDEVWFQKDNFRVGVAVPKSFDEIPHAICRAALKAVGGSGRVRVRGDAERGGGAGAG